MGLGQPNPQHGVGGGALSLPQDRYITTMVVGILVLLGALKCVLKRPYESMGTRWKWCVVRDKRTIELIFLQ